MKRSLQTLIKSQKSEKPNSRSRKNRIQEVGKTDPNYINDNQTDINYINPINQIEAKSDRMDTRDNVQAYINLIKDNICYDHHMKYDDYGKREYYDELFRVICEIVCVNRETVRIAGEEYPYELVKSRFLKLNSSHLEYVIDCMKNTTTKITNIKSYMITALYNAPSTINHFYQQEVQHDLFG